MNYCSKIVFVGSLTILSACSSKSNEQATKLNKFETPDSTVLAANNQQRQDSAIEKNIECARGQAEPITKKNYFPTTSFVLQPDSITAVETVNYKNGDKLVITNWGCEYYVLTFRFETSIFKADTSNLNYWYAAAGKLMAEVMPGIDAPFDIEGGVRVMNNYAAKNTGDLRIGRELNVDGDEATRFAALETVAKMPKNRTAVVLSFTAGPL